MNDETIAERFWKVIEENQKLIYKVSRMYCDNVHDRNDLFQEIIANIWEAFPNFNGNSKISTWMYRIAINTSISWLRDYVKSKKHVQYTDITPQINEEADINELTEKLYNTINHLGKIDKAIILLQLDGYTYDEISEIIGLSKTNVATKINRIKQKLKNHLSNH